MIHEHISEAIKLPNLVRLDRNLYMARFETMKVYSTLAAVKSLLESGRINKDTTLIDSSSGIYAYALALACHRYGLKCHIVGSRTVDRTLLLQLKILGATVQQVETEGTLKLDQKRRVEIVNDILAKHPEYHWMRQYHDDIHYKGYEPVAEHFRSALGESDLTLVASVGSGCSSGGIATAMRSSRQNVHLVGIQPFGSITFGSEHIEDPGIIIAGIGSSIPFDNVHHDLYDEIHWISFDYSLSGAIALLRDHAVFAGLSSGCCYMVAAREARLNPDKNVLFVAPDMGHRYVEGVFAHHEQARPLEELKPLVVSEQSELTLPWSCTAWKRSEQRWTIGASVQAQPSHNSEVAL